MRYLLPPSRGISTKYQAAGEVHVM